MGRVPSTDINRCIDQVIKAEIHEIHFGAETVLFPVVCRSVEIEPHRIGVSTSIRDGGHADETRIDVRLTSARMPDIVAFLAAVKRFCNQKFARPTLLVATTLTFIPGMISTVPLDFHHASTDRIDSDLYGANAMTIYAKIREFDAQWKRFVKGGGDGAIKPTKTKLGFLLHGPPGTGKTSFILSLIHI